MRFRLGLTGSIGMGKSTTAQMFADLGCPVWDADAAVHRLYSKGGAAVAPLGELFPAVIRDGAVSRDALRSVIALNPENLRLIEGIVHPLVRRDRADFAQTNTDCVGIFDIPLLFETGSDKDMDAVACVTIPAELQRKRVLERGTMTAQDLDLILNRQMPNDDKCASSDYVIMTDTKEHAREQVRAILDDIERRLDA